MSTTKEPLKPAAPASPKSEETEDLTRRLLLYEVLLEEYETHCPPDETEAKNPEEGPVTQPRLSREELHRVRKKGKEKKVQCEGMKPDAEKEQFEEENNGERVTEFFSLLTEKQKEETRKKFKQLSDKYENKEKLKPILKAAGHRYKSETHGEIMNRVVAAHVFGTLDDYEENEKQSRARTGRGQDGDGSVRNEAEKPRCEDAELLAVTAVLDSAREGSPPLPPGESGAGDSSTGSGGDSEPGNAGDGRHYDPMSEARWAYGRSLRSALCLSGGGIRSATFNLGILQGLARHGLLQQFDYLSTVSGGGFIGGWLTAWMHRQGIQKVMEKLTEQPPSPVKPEPSPINHLRVFSNYLSPRPGLLSADTWTLIATLLRNLMLTWLVFVPFLVLALMVPRAWMAIVSSQMQSLDTGHGRVLPIDWLPWIAWVPFDWFFWVGTIAGWISFTFSGIELSKRKKIPPPPNLDPYKNHDTRFLIGCLLPGVVSAAALSVYWTRVADGGYSWGAFMKFSVWLIMIPWLFTVLFRLGKAEAKPPLSQIGLATLLILAVQALIAGLLYALATNAFPQPAAHPRLYATFTVPLILSVLMTGCALIAGLTSTLTKDEDMEWWSRAGAWFLIVIVGWAAMNLLVLFGPPIILLFGDAVKTLRKPGAWDKESLKSLGQVLTVVGGVISGVITLMGGFSGKTSADGKETPATGSLGRLLGWLTNILGPVFLAFLIMLLSLGTSWLLTSTVQIYRWLPDRWGVPSRQLLELDPSKHEAFVIHTPLLLILTASLLVLVVGMVMGLLINTNKFSLHFTWRDRIIRAYLGASRTMRNPQPFTNFDTDDNLYMCELRQQPHGIKRPEVLEKTKARRDEYTKERPRKLFHILNIALNLAGGDKLAWQDRKAESFTVSPLHAGSYWLGYRRSLAYGGDDGGISLGTAVAISGAFVSPNMGYMMTSPVVRFLMTLFNARFGWWLGNPGAAGDKTYPLVWVVATIRGWFGERRRGHPFESASPALSVLPIVAEAFGKTNDKSPYVYLSDGGHFENLGLYEMVLRRCRFIVVCDASTDAGYSFDSLAQSIRQIRVDLGVPIDIRELSITTPSQDLKGKYCAVGRIRYSCVDRRAAHAQLDDADFDGTLIYIKASMIGEEPRDVVNYGQGSQSFPQEIIVDQWFSEAQFESYRALGSHIIDVIASEGLDNIASQNRISLAAFERKALRHNQMNFRIFKERLSYDALASEFKRTMRRYAPTEYKSRVRRYLDNLLG